jgi:hypothetical protein
LLISSIPGFEFPRKNINNYILDTAAPVSDTNTIDLLENDNSCFLVDLSYEEINILALLMLCAWL